MVKIEFSTGNAAFHAEDPEDKNLDTIWRNTAIKDILRSIINQIDSGKEYGPCMDINGNKVGEWSISRQTKI